MTESSTAGITTTQCEAYRLTKRGQEHEVVSEPEYDAIPTFEGKQEQGQHDYENIITPPPVSMHLAGDRRKNGGGMTTY